jgi:predicted dehydrogenase
MKTGLESTGERRSGKLLAPESSLQPARCFRLPRSLWKLSLFIPLACLALNAAGKDLKLITLDPGHFHAALFQRERLPGVADEAWVYAPLGPDLAAHLNRVAQFNLRRDNPTRWKLQVRTGPDFFERMLADRRGEVVVLSGRNRGKIDRIGAIVGSRLHVLADKPWIIELAELSNLSSALELAEKRRVAAWDAMTERFEITALLQKALVNDPDIFGARITGSVDEPAVQVESTHHLLKEVSGVPNLRPTWFFDIRQQGEGLADVGTHLVDNVPWVLFPEQAIHCTNDIQVLRATRWPTTLTLEQFKRVTGVGEFPDFLRASVTEDSLPYFCNNTVSYTLRGIHVKLDVKWDFEAAPGVKDNSLSVFRGGTSRVEVRQGRGQEYRREVYVVPNRPRQKATVLAAVSKRVEALQANYPGLAVRDELGGVRLEIPERFRVSHEEHFALVVRRFLEYVRDPKLMPAWEKPNMLAKYYVTTMGVHLARQNPATTANH